MPLTINQYTGKDSFSFVNSLISLQNVSFMASFDVVSLIPNIPLKETIEICLDKLYSDTDLVHNLSRKTLKTLLNRPYSRRPTAISIFRRICPR